MTVQYDVATEDRGFRRMTSPFQAMRPRKLSLISEEVHQNVNQRLWSSLRGPFLLVIRGYLVFIHGYSYSQDSWDDPPSTASCNIPGFTRRKKRLRHDDVFFNISPTFQRIGLRDNLQETIDFPMNYGGFPVFPRNQSHPRRPVWLLSLRRSLKVELLACHWAVGKMSCFEMERKQPKNMD